MTALEDVLADAGGPAASPARVRKVLADALDYGRDELAKPRSGHRERPVEVAVAADGGRLLAVAPADAAVRVDTAKAGPRAWSVLAALVDGLVSAAELSPPATANDLLLAAGDLEGHLLLGLPAREPDVELAQLCFEEAVEDVDRLRAAARVVPAGALGPAAELRPPTGADHPLRAYEAVARLGGRPAESRSYAEYEEQVLALTEPEWGHVPAHDDPDPARRVARRILRRLDGMGKWGGYHTEWAHLSRGFAGNDRRLADEVGKSLVDAGLLEQKPSVGQLHVYLNTKRSGEIQRFIADGTVPADLHLP